LNIKILIALFLCLICVGMASATLSVKNIESTHGAGYRAVNDIIGIKVSSSSNVSVGGIQCIQQDDPLTYMCIITDKATSAISTYTVRNSEGQTTTTSIKVDNKIGAMSYTIVISQNSAKMNYTVQDLGYNNNNACSGIKTLTVYDGESVLNTVEINGAPGVCFYTGAINLSIGDSGIKQISLEATDNVGNVNRTPKKNLTFDIDAPEILDGLVVKYFGSDAEVLVLSNTASFLVDIYFSIREENLASIKLDLSRVNTNPSVQYAYRNVVLPVSNCVENLTYGSKVYECVVKSVPMKISGNSLDINVTAKDIYGATSNSTLSKPFEIDNIVPEVSIKTERCDSAGNCYIKNGMNKIIFTMSKDNFEKKKNVFFKFSDSGTTYKVQNCSGTECTSNLPLTCSSGAQVDISIVNLAGFSSQDDAGNTVKPYSTYLYCDNIAPKITDINVTSQSSTILLSSEIVSGSTLTLTVKVDEADSDEINAVVWLDKLRNATEEGECAVSGDYKFTCVWTISDIAKGYYEANILVNISDSAGNMASKYYRFKVFGHKPDNETPDSLDIKFIGVYPSTINRVVLDMATWNGIPYYVYATYGLSILHGKNVSVLHQQVDLNDCKYVQDSGPLSGGSVSATTVICDI
jgi:hypothetical protein